jgi:Pyrimidine dimer DNA glycosylase
MNIFLTDPCPRQCAINLDDKRVNKMLLETAQLLSSALRHRGYTNGIYKNTHVNHPCAVWTRSSRAAFSWMLEHGFALADEYAYRYNTRRRDKSLLDDNRYYDHACVSVLTIAAVNRSDFFPDDGLPLIFNFNSSGQTRGRDVFENYQLCMSNKWLHLDKQRPLFTRRTKPKFYSCFRRNADENLSKRRLAYNIRQAVDRFIT